MKLQFSVLSKKWTMRLLDRKRYNKKHGNDSLAITHVQKRRIDLSPKGMDLATITHELVHAYLAELCVHSCDLDDENLEEIFAELLSRRGREMLTKAQAIHSKVSKLRKRVA